MNIRDKAKAHLHFHLEYLVGQRIIIWDKKRVKISL